MPDIFQYQNNVNQDEVKIASSEFAQISMSIEGSGQNALVQSFRAQYGQQIEEIMQVGSPKIHWLPGRPSGSIDMGELVGDQGFFQAWQGSCGYIKTAAINMEGEGPCQFKSGRGGLNFTGGIVENVGLELAVNRQTISQTARARVASMSIT